VFLSCSGSDQVGYDVKINLIAPVETNAADPRPDIVVPVALSPSNPSYDLGFIDTGRWTSDLRREATLRGQGASPGFDMSMGQFSFTADGTVDFLVRVFSRNGYISGRDRSYVPTTPASCSFTLDPGTATGSDYASNINQCLSDWVTENGVPLRFDMQVTSSGVSPSAAALKSGFATKATASDYKFDGEWNMGSSGCDEEKDPDCCDGAIDDQDVLDAVRDGSDFFGVLDCATLTVKGEGTIDKSQKPEEDPVVNLTDIGGGADIYDACGNHLSTATMETTNLETPPNQPRTYTIDEAGNSPDVKVTFDPPDPGLFFRSLLAAANEECIRPPPAGTERGEPYAEVDWQVCGDVPRKGTITVVAEGNCQLVEDGDAGVPDSGSDGGVGPVPD
jgi:hypothetical protein